MKNKLGLLAGLSLALVPVTTLTSCGGGSSSSNLRITVSTSSINSIRKFQESEESSKEVYTIFINVSNESKNTVTLKNTDFKVSVNGKESTALFFVGKTKTSMEDGVWSYVILTKSETYEVEPDKDDGTTVSTSSFTLAFEDDITSNPTFYYNGSQIEQRNI